MKNNTRKVIFSCEHASNFVPEKYRNLFHGKEDVLDTHLAYDMGSLELAKRAASEILAPVYGGEMTRLVADLNRSPGNKKSLFSAYSRSLSVREKEEILKRYYFPYRERVDAVVEKWVAQGLKTLHFSMHTFTDTRGGKVRDADIGLLYDPRREEDSRFCKALQRAIRKKEPSLRVRMNYPYLGKSDGFVSFLRKKYSMEMYTGIELEVNIKFPRTGGGEWESLKSGLAKALREAVLSGP